jgi:hypothetical protein
MIKYYKGPIRWSEKTHYFKYNDCSNTIYSDNGEIKTIYYSFWDSEYNRWWPIVGVDKNQLVPVDESEIVLELL